MKPQRALIVAFSSLVLLTGVQQSEGCIMARPYAPEETLRGLSPTEIIQSFPELVVEGVVEGNPTEAAPITPTAGSGAYWGWASLVAEMRIDKVWKGKAPNVIKLRFNPPGAMCIHLPPFGERIRIGVLQISDQEFFYNGLYDLPLDQPSVDALLQDYRVQSDALEAAAQAGDRTAQLALGEHLFRNHEAHRARDLYESLAERDSQDIEALLRLAVIRTWFGVDGEPAMTLNQARLAAPASEDADRRIAQTYFDATGAFEPGRLDFSNFDASKRCRVGEANLDGVSFDGADLSGCEFHEASLRKASFRGANLSDTYFGYFGTSAAYDHADLTGAKYDCATKLPDDLDPVAAGMINVAGSCPTPTP